MRLPLVILVVVSAMLAFIVPNPAPVSAYACGTMQVPWPVEAGDEDCDGFAFDEEVFTGTFPWVMCPATDAVRDEDPDAWPPDFNDDQWVDIADINKFAPPLFFSTAPGPPYEPRYDLTADGIIDISDVNVLAPPLFFTQCTVSPGAPVPSVSRYIATTDDLSGTNDLRDAGYAQADAPEGPIDSVVILAFGRPWYENGGYGVVLPGSNMPITVDQVREAAKDYLRGFWSCSAYNPTRHVTLVIGTSNCVNHSDCPPQGAPYSDWQHGQAWAAMVNSVNTWIDSPPSYRSRETAWGGNDIELDWNTPLETRNWVDG